MCREETQKGALNSPQIIEDNAVSEFQGKQKNCTPEKDCLGTLSLEQGTIFHTMRKNTMTNPLFVTQRVFETTQMSSICVVFLKPIVDPKSCGTEKLQRQT